MIALESDTKLVNFARMFMSKLDGFIFTFMFTMSGTMLVLFRNILAVGIMLRINDNPLLWVLSLAAKPSNSLSVILLEGDSVTFSTARHRFDINRNAILVPKMVASEY